MADTEGGQPATYSFLIHSSSPSDSSLRFDSAANPKQKRRRTSPHDHAILEAAYLKNSKPDKKERADIVSQVDLGEKEVQIWFQNRRQNDRRKSKPLQPHELLAHFRNAAPAQAAVQPENTSMPQSQHDATQPVSTALQAGDIARPSSRSSSIHELLNPTSPAEPELTSDQASDRQKLGELMPTPPASFNASQQKDFSQVLPSSSSSSDCQPGHSRKRSHEVMANTIETKHEAQQYSDARVLPPLKKSSSFVRLAMTVDGAVKVRTNNELTPSPPKQRLPPLNITERRNNTLTRSQSDVNTPFEFRDVNSPIRRIGTAGFGRSRDVRTWEFYCDRDSSDTLATQAEAESSGSAVGAINLIRSSSQRSKGHALSPNIAKQNTRRILPDPTQAKAKLVRAKSSMGRLQNFSGSIDTAETQAKRPRHERSSSRDSDKENWAPGTRASFNPLRRMHPSAPRSSILQSTERRSLHSGDQGGVGTSVDKPVTTNTSTPGKAKRDDMDCIQGLLSLSQGAWR